MGCTKVMGFRVHTLVSTSSEVRTVNGINETKVLARVAIALRVLGMYHPRLVVACEMAFHTASDRRWVRQSKLNNSRRNAGQRFHTSHSSSRDKVCQRFG